MITVTIRECRSGGLEWTSRHRTDNEEAAIDRAIARYWGRSASLSGDHGLRDIGRYGQIVTPARTGGYNCMTGRVRIEVSHG